jgi:hypothetical protein
MPHSLAPAMAGGYSALSPLPVGGRRRKSHGKSHGKSHKKTLRIVKKSTVHNMLKKKGMKMRGGDGEGMASPAPPPPPPATGGRRSRRRSHRRRGFSLF